MKTPLAVMSFNRPALLRLVLESLKNQTAAGQLGAPLEDREIHLFQDGAVNKYSKIRYATDEDIEASVATFKDIFPSGIVHDYSANLGVCENFLRAERFFFEEREDECAYFFEDDMVLSPSYLTMMDLLWRYVQSTPRIAYFAAYGNYYADKEEIREHSNEVITLDHHWAFGLKRTAWLKMQDALQDYYKIVVNQDYARRDHRAVYEYYKAQGASPRGSSQDAAKAFTCAKLGLWRCRTFTPFARYIGATGAHMTPEQFETLGFSNTVIAEKPLSRVFFPDDRQIEEFIELERNLFVDIFKNELATIMAGLPAKKLNPMRRCTADDVRMAYRLLLHRDPESEAVVERYVRATTVHTLVQSLLSSGEYISLRDRISAS